METRWIVACTGALLWGGALADSEILCEVSSANFAWVPEYGGTVIATSGTVALFEYDFKKSPRDRDGLYRGNWLTSTRQELAKRFRPGRRVVGKKYCAVLHRLVFAPETARNTASSGGLSPRQATC